MRFKCRGARLNRLPFELADVQVVVEAAPIKQRLMRALFDLLAVIDHDHLIGIADGAQPVRDHAPSIRAAGPLAHPSQRRARAWQLVRLRTQIALNPVRHPNPGLGRDTPMAYTPLNYRDSKDYP